MSILAIIPARGGSKRIEGKNIRPFLGKPVIAYSIEAALDSKLFDEVMVSTDDESIAGAAHKYGAEIPFMRSARTSDDHATLSDVISEVLREYAERGRTFDYFCCILATAPLVTAGRLREGFGKMTEGGYDSVFPVAQFSYPVQRSLRMEGGRVEMADQGYMDVRSQDLEPRYHDSGQFYFMKTSEFLSQGVLFARNSGALILSGLEVQDIDTEEDWTLAEMKYTKLHGV